MNAHHPDGSQGGAEAQQRKGSQRTESEHQHQAEKSIPADAVELILRELVAMRSSATTDDQLIQLLRLVDSATWSAPVPMTVLIDGALLRGLLVPSEVSAAYLDDALSRSARNAINQLDTDNEQAAEVGTETAPQKALLKEQARAFLNRTRRRPFSVAQARTRQRNANALIALNRWRTSSEYEGQPTTVDIPGSYADPESVARAAIPYMAGQRAMTLSDVKMLLGADWIAIQSPLRVAIHRVGAWAVEQ